MNNKTVQNKKTLSLSVEEWHELSLGGADVSVSFYLSGESMRPLIRKLKDKVTVVPVYRSLKKGDIVLFKRSDGAYVVHRINKINNSTVVTIGDNCVDFDSPVSVADIWGIVTDTQRNGRKLKTDSPAFRMLGIFIMSTRPFRSLYKKTKKLGAVVLKRLRGAK